MPNPSQIDVKPEVKDDPDALYDEQGLIPHFPPPTRDAEGNWQHISEEEWAARADSLRRALNAIARMTGNSDTPEIWAEFDRAMAENQRRKDELYGEIP